MKSSLAVVIQGGGPVGLACAAWLLQKNPHINLILIDRNPEGDEQIQAGDQRGIALSHGSKLLLDTINAWPSNCPAIHRIHVSQVGRFGRALMTREELGQDALGHISGITTRMKASVRHQLPASYMPRADYLSNKIGLSLAAITVKPLWWEPLMLNIPLPIKRGSALPMRARLHCYPRI
ncbi:MAG: hypothetical protein RLZZ586_1424 [Pseudomonadota bacterium]